MQKYDVNQHLIETLLAWVRSGEIAIPEIQRPFVWKPSKVRDLLDSLYKGYPVGYLIAWKSPNVKLKDGSQSAGKRILIDGQQRVTALRAAVLGEPVVTQTYDRRRIRVAFHPLLERFEIPTAIIDRDPSWISDVAEVFDGSKSLLKTAQAYCTANPDADVDTVFERLDTLKGLVKRQVGVIELAGDLDIETVTEIFIRINSQGVVLSQADFVMSKIAASEDYGGPTLRKLVDYFCHLAIEPTHADRIAENDPAFAATDDWRRIAWLRNQSDDLYDPSYTDVLRVAFTSEFGRGKLSSLVALLSGRDFSTRSFEAEIARDTFERLTDGVRRVVDRTHFERFLMIIRSAGFVSKRLIRSQNALNFAYILYLRLRDLKVDPAEIEQLVRRWFVLNILTGRYSGAAETALEEDVRLIDDRVADNFRSLEQAALSDAFWDFGLPQALDTSVASNPRFLVFLAAQAKAQAPGFLSRDILVGDLITHRFDIHHVFPQAYLKRHGHERDSYNQVANYVVTQSEINIRIGARAPDDYLHAVEEQTRTGVPAIGGLTDSDALHANLAAHAVPDDTALMTAADYPTFLDTRRRLMSQIVRRYYQSL